MEEQAVLVKFRQDDLPGFALINIAAADFAHSHLYDWHVSILIQCDQLGDNGMPSPLEQELLDQFEDRLQPQVSEGENGIFLARVTWDGLREIIWRVKNPEPTNAMLEGIVESKNHPRPFDFRIDPDPNWEKAAWYLDSATATQPGSHINNQIG